MDETVIRGNDFITVRQAEHMRFVTGRVCCPGMAAHDIGAAALPAQGISASDEDNTGNRIRHWHAELGQRISLDSGQRGVNLIPPSPVVETPDA